MTEMDKVVQQNAANGEESVPTAEEMSSQAERLKEIVSDLAELVVGGAAKETSEARLPVTRAAGKTRSHAPEPKRLTHDQA
ncbi:MAG: hypothetical protein MUO63_03620 [Desulfobulbaceae bacterium]|nr:hypothetical protein [Desulfobulbaceae bacterium]